MNTQHKDLQINIQKQLDGLERLSDETVAELINNRTLLWTLIGIHPNIAELKAKFLELHDRSIERLFFQAAKTGLSSQEVEPLHSLVKQDADKIISHLEYLEPFSSSNKP